MNNNVLVITEGEKTEPKLFCAIKQAFDMKLDVLCLKSNIYALYKKMCEYDFNANIKDVLVELNPGYKAILDRKFAYTYLVFDLDPHHPLKNDERSIEEIAISNIFKVDEMAKHFVNETDPTIGKLYVNYPMVESYRDCDDTFDPNYKEAFVRLSDITKYKFRVGKSKLSNTRIEKYDRRAFSRLIVQNVYKLNYIMTNRWSRMGYQEYVANSNSKKIIEKEKEFMIETGKIKVLNTSLFLPIDYFGNRNGFYDSLYEFI